MRTSHAYNHFDLSKLFCYGCAHSAAEAPFPGHPSGERPCCFCVRNPEREKWLERAKKDAHWDWNSSYNPYTGHWYDGSEAVAVPQDNYTTLDMKDQIQKWYPHGRRQSDINLMQLPEES